MKNLHEFSLSSLALLLVFSGTVFASTHKVDVCHNGRVINVSADACPAHQKHGDYAVSDDGECLYIPLYCAPIYDDDY